MKKPLILLLTLLLPILTFAQQERGWDERINDAFQPVTNAVAGVVFYAIQLGESSSTALPIVIIILLTGATIFTIYFRFIQFRGFKLAIDTVRGKYSNPDDEGEVSHFQALTAALSGTVGLGNIAGVAIAISLGGPGATFWMILAGLLGMASKFTECTLGVKYRDVGPDGTVYGGPMYYLTKGLAEKGYTGLGKVLAVFFAIMCIGGSFGGGNMFQANQAAQQFNNMIGATSGSAGVVFGIVMAVVVAIVNYWRNQKNWLCYREGCTFYVWHLCICCLNHHFC